MTDREEPLLEQLVKHFAKITADEIRRHPAHTLEQHIEPKLRAFSIRLASILTGEGDPTHDHDHGD